MPFGLGLPEMLVILGVGVLVFGPKKLPELGNSIGKALRGFKEGVQEIENKPVVSETPSPKTPPTSIE